MTQLRTGLRWGFGMLVAVGLLGMPAGTPGQELSTQIGARAVGEPVGPMPEIPPGRRTFGTANEIVRTYDAWSFVGNATGVVTTGDTGASLRSGGSTALTLGLDLPAGAQILRLELDGCDLSASTGINLRFFRANTPPQTGAAIVVQGNTGISAMPGCDVFEFNLPGGPLEVNNATQHYFIWVVGQDVFLSAVRVFYRLQVSPAPAVATFSDVPPSHHFFRFIEALALSGITSGCGGGNFCPDVPLTRGQMAVFLSLGLGLHFAP